MNRIDCRLGCPTFQYKKIFAGKWQVLPPKTFLYDHSRLHKKFQIIWTIFRGPPRSLKFSYFDANWSFGIILRQRLSESIFIQKYYAWYQYVALKVEFQNTMQFYFNLKWTVQQHIENFTEITTILYYIIKQSQFHKPNKFAVSMN